VLARRRMVRHYRAEPVSREVLARIVAVVARSPSAGHSQGHRIAVVTDPVRRRRLADIAEAWYLERGCEPWLSQAGAHLVLGVRPAAYRERYGQPDKLRPDGSEIDWPVPFWWFDAGALFMMIQLAALDEGLVTGFYSPAEPAELAAVAAVAEFGDDVRVAGVITVGHAVEQPAAARVARGRGRKPLAETVSWLEG
jgi:FMN reductase [NAD(P)H]